MKYFCGLVALSLLLGSGWNALGADKRPVVAVFEVQTKRMKLSTARAELLTGLMAEELAIGGTYQVMPPGDVKRALLGQSSESFKECYDEKCQIALGRQLPANKLLTCTVMKMGKQCRVSASLYDLRKQTTDTTEKTKGGCTEDQLMESIVAVASKLRQWAGEASSDVTLPKEDAAAKPAPGSDARAYKQALNKAWRMLAKGARRGTTQQKLEKYQAFLADFPEDNPHAAKVQKNIEALEGKLERQAAAKRAAEEKQAALEAKRQRAKALKAAYNKAKAAKGSAAEQVATWKKFMADYPDANPYLKTARKSLARLEPQLKREEQAKLIKEADSNYENAAKAQYGNPKDMKKAVSLYRKACDGKNGASCYTLGRQYFDGRDLVHDYRKAFALFRKGCDLENLSSCSLLANMYANGEGVAQNPKMAVKLRLKACQNGDGSSCSNLGHMHEAGAGLAKSDKEAVKYYQKACNIGGWHCAFLAKMYAEGKGVPKNAQTAKSYYAKACKDGNSASCALAK